MNTNIETKLRLWPVFAAACERQLSSGGERYRLTKDKESTDLICEGFGNDWIGGTINKYTYEIKNSAPKIEQDFFKIAVWAFLWWIREQENLTGHDKGEET